MTVVVVIPNSKPRLSYKMPIDLAATRLIDALGNIQSRKLAMRSNRTLAAHVRESVFRFGLPSPRKSFSGHSRFRDWMRHRLHGLTGRHRAKLLADIETP